MVPATRVSYVAAEGQREFTVTFPYLLAEHVEVQVSSVPLPRAAYEWIGRDRVRLKSDPGAGNTVTLRRRTPLDQALVKFRNGSVLTEEELNNAVLQILYVQQELTDLYTSSLDAAKVRLGDNLGIVTDPQAVMDELVQMVLADELLAGLNQRLADVNLNATTLIEEQLRSFDLKRGVNVIRDEVRVLSDETTQLASVVDLLAILAEDGQSIVLREDRVRRSGGDTLAQAFTAIETGLADTSASLVTLEQTIVGPEGALTQLRQRLGVEDPNGSGFILNDEIVKLTSGASLGETFDGLTVRLGDAEAGLITTQQAIADETSARVSAISALIARVGDAESSITSIQQVEAGLLARVGVALDVNGYVSGWVLNNNGQSSSFNILASQFAVVDPNQGSPIVPFEVSNGWLIAPRIRAGDIFANTVTTDKLVVGGVTTDRIADNAVSNGTSAFSGWVTSVSPGSMASLQAAGFSTNGGRVQLVFSCYVNPITFPHLNNPATQQTLVTYYVYRNGSLIQTVVGGVAIKVDGTNYLLPGGLSSFVLTDTPPPGWATYEVYAVTGTLSGMPLVQFDSRGLNLLETKK